MVTLAPVPFMVMELPPVSVPRTPLNVTAADELVVEAILNVTPARAPSLMTVLLKPTTTQRTSPALTTLQVTDLPAALEAPRCYKNSIRKEKESSSCKAGPTAPRPAASRHWNAT